MISKQHSVHCISTNTILCQFAIGWQCKLGHVFWLSIGGTETWRQGRCHNHKTVRSKVGQNCSEYKHILTYDV